MHFHNKILLAVCSILVLVPYNHILSGQSSSTKNLIFIDVNSIINPKNCNEVLSDKMLLSTESRCFGEIKNTINQKPSEDFMVIYLFDNAEGQSHFFRIFRASDQESIADSLFDYRKLPTYNFLDYNVRAINLLEQLYAWDMDIRELQNTDLHFYSGCDSFVAKDIEFDYINRIIRLAGLIEENTLQLFPTHKFFLHYNGGTNQPKRKNDLYKYVTTSF
jgi:hypothetical protein